MSDQNSMFRLLSEARNAFLDELKTGRVVRCECCGKKSKRYTHSMVSIFARGIIWFDRLEVEWFHLGDQDSAMWAAHHAAWERSLFREPKAEPKDTHSATSKLAFWNLIEEAEGGRPGHKGKAFRVSELGHEFAHGRATVSQKVTEYRTQVLGFSGPQVDVHQALGKFWDYDELMSARP